MGLANLKPKHSTPSTEGAELSKHDFGCEVSIMSTPIPWLTLLLVLEKIVLSKIHVNQVS